MSGYLGILYGFLKIPLQATLCEKEKHILSFISNAFKVQC